MKKTILLLCTLLAVGYTTAQTAAAFLRGEQGTDYNGMSPDGKYVVGERTGESHGWGLDAITGYVSYLQDLSTGEITWMTSWTDGDYTTLGSFADVSDDGIICGTAKDVNNMITVTELGYTYTLPLNTAAVWTKDGEAKILGLGTYSVDDFNNFNDGTFAKCISKDAKIVTGYVAIGNYAFIYPCRWVLNDATGEYTYQAYSLPDESTEGQVVSISDDGSVACGYYKIKGKYTPCYWPTPDECVSLDDGTLTGYQGCKAFCISGNGKYIVLTLDKYTPKIYAVDTKEFRAIGDYQNPKKLAFGGVTNSGDVIGTVQLQDRIYPFYYNYSNALTTGFDYYVYRTAYNINIPYKFDGHSGESVSFVGVSADGTVVSGNDADGSPWTLSTGGTTMGVIPPTVEDFDVAFSGIGSVSITFGRGQEQYMDFEAAEYIVYRDAEVVGRVSVEELDNNSSTSVTFTDSGVESGTHYYAVALNWINADDKIELLSPKSPEKSIYVDNDAVFPLYDNFDSGSLSYNGWTVQRDYGETEYQNWGCPKYFGINSTPCLYSSCDQLLPYSYSVVSCRIDASDKDEVYMSFAHYWEYVNSREWALDKDTMSLELSVDGGLWETVKDYPLCDYTAYRMTFDYIDLTPYAAGTTFQVRFRLHGQAVAQYAWRIENLTIDEKPQHEGTAGAIGFTGSDGKFHLTWKNSLDAYSLSYLGSPYMDGQMYAAGNEGKPLTAVNKFDAVDLAAYKGKYLTSVMTSINKYESEDNTPLRVAVVVYEGDKLIREQELSEFECNTDFVAKLDNPVLIDGSKDMMIGIKLLEYGADQLPISYMSTKEACVKGKSDLYSEDGGKTWMSFAETFGNDSGQDTDGNPSWFIIGNVTDTPEAVDTQLDTNQYAYEVYKNGRKYSERFVYFLEPGFVDEESVQGDTYEIRTFFYDGTVSKLSETVCNNGTTAIENVQTGGNGVWNIDGDRLNITDGADNIEIYTANGMKVYEGIPTEVNFGVFGHGLFILKVYADNGDVTSHKVIL